MSNRLVIFHADCTDGFTAAWVARKKWPDAEFVPARYDDRPPEYAGKDVLILDFSYPRPVVVDMHHKAASFSLIDHHQSAFQELDTCQGCLINLGHSGAMLAWKEFLGKGSDIAPPLVSYVEDRDLWKWELPASKEVNAAISSYPHTFEQWDELERRWLTRDMWHEGGAILRYQEQLIERICKDAYDGSIADHIVSVVNTPVLQSEVGHKLAEDKEFAATYFRQGDHWNFSLRSDGSGIDVAEIAKQFGGGGHPHAAGFNFTDSEEPVSRLPKV